MTRHPHDEFGATHNCLRPLIAAASFAVMAVPLSVVRADEVALPDYEDAIAAALEHYAAGDFGGARQDFERAHALNPGARTLRGVGLSAYYAGDYVTAVRAFEEALDESRHPLSPEQRTQVGDLLARAYDQVGRVRVKATPESAAIRIDEATVANDELVLLAPGRYRLEVAFPGRVPRTQTIEVASGQQVHLHIELSTEAPPSIPDGPVLTPPAVREARGDLALTAPTPPSRQQSPTLAPWIAAGATLTAGGSAALFAILAEDEVDTVRARCRRAPVCDEPTRDALWNGSSVETYETLINVSLVAAAAGALTTAALFLLLPADDAHRRASLRMQTAGNGLQLSASF